MDRLNDNLERRIKGIETQMQDYKSVQPMTADSLLTYFTSSSANYDFMTNVPMMSSKTYKLTFEYETAKHGAIIDMKLFYRINNSNVMANPELPFWSTAPEILIRYLQEPSTDTKTVWQFIIFNSLGIANRDVYMKFFFSGTDRGTFSVTAY